MSKETITIINFNNILVELCKLIKNIDPNSLIGDNYVAICGCLRNSANESYLLEFASRILTNKEFKKQILDGNDSFFTNYSNESYAKQSGLPIDSILIFKNIWKKCNLQAKNKVKNYMRLMVNYSDNYLNSI